MGACKKIIRKGHNGKKITKSTLKKDCSNIFKIIYLYLKSRGGGKCPILPPTLQGAHGE